MSDTQEKLCPECGLPITICNIVYFASIGFSEVKTVQQEYQRDARKEVQDLIESAKQEAYKQGYIDAGIKALTEQSKESE